MSLIEKCWTECSCYKCHTTGVHHHTPNTRLTAASSTTPSHFTRQNNLFYVTLRVQLLTFVQSTHPPSTILDTAKEESPHYILLTVNCTFSPCPSAVLNLSSKQWKKLCEFQHHVNFTQIKFFKAIKKKMFFYPLAPHYPYCCINLFFNIWQQSKHIRLNRTKFVAVVFFLSFLN